MKINHFEDLPVWQHSMNISIELYQLIEDSPIKTDYFLKNQLRRAILSITSNIAEGFERNNSKEFIRFLTFSKGSAGEVRSQLNFAFRVGYIDEKVYAGYRDQLIKLSMQMKGFITYFQKRLNEKQ